MCGCGLAVAVAVAGNYSCYSIPSLGTSIYCSKKTKRQTDRQTDRNLCFPLIPSSLLTPYSVNL